MGMKQIVGKGEMGQGLKQKTYTPSSTIFPILCKNENTC
jgi:hypothetical protein